MNDNYIAGKVVDIEFGENKIAKLTININDGKNVHNSYPDYKHIDVPFCTGKQCVDYIGQTIQLRFMVDLVKQSKT